ncbi:hypothetical protein Curi_c17230 [Gottschalkia acidurici 9a]|uniref:Uncharacterized protein n=1 Tax=Gottschalkia acidurici (strain ATCC 7906 / DSM 604 / BCRC 14475 / CIP 104303 / KCTC 5404 / NCIMB 10678 / 9a) TaxID=1128398 RepID=K0B188_GOTA9|nr:YIEGIA family protein [Gottschalkia acidurici]AFS78730.1 hypothetical protein Curi_c17230 [Gottschalkia acidurici 9a]
MFKYGFIIVPSIIIGFVSRLSMLKVDHRQYPSYPQGFLTHLTLGLIASALGSVAVPSIISNEFAAVTFLSLAAQQFRDVRNLERQSLDNMEPTELVARGTAYIEDIAKAFEARNYVTMIVSLTCSIVIYIMFILNIPKMYCIIVGIIVSIVTILILNKLISRQTLQDMADVKKAKITFDGPLLKINNTIIMNIGLEASREIYLKSGIAVEIIPHNDNGVVTLANIGQRQAILHNAAELLGIRKDVDEPDFSPIARRDPDTGRVLLSLVAMHPDEDALLDVVRGTIVLESAKRKPLNTKVARRASD